LVVHENGAAGNLMSPFEENPSDYFFTATSTLEPVRFTAYEPGNVSDVGGNGNRLIQEDYVEFVIEKAADADHEEQLHIPVSASNFSDVNGFQFGLHWDAEALKFVGVNKGAVLPETFVNVDEKSRLSLLWEAEDAMALTLQDNEVLFTLVFEKTKAFRNFASLSIGSDLTPEEVVKNQSAVEFISYNALVQDWMERQEVVNYPNPFTIETNFQFFLTKNDYVEIAIFDPAGKIIDRHASYYSEGLNQWRWNMQERVGYTMPQGFYIYKVTFGEKQFTGKMMIR
jgi:hypothetical protein